MSPDEASGLSREAVVAAGLAMLNDQGVEALSMRGLADRLGVKAASLYWHLRDKEQLLELVAEAIVDRVEVPLKPAGWRGQAEATAAGLAAVLAEVRDSATVLLACLPSIQRSRLVRDLARVLMAAGVSDAESAAFALVVQVVSMARTARPVVLRPKGRTAFTLAIDSGSHKVNVRGGDDDVDVARSIGGGGAASIDVDESGRVMVRSRRGGNRGGIELNPRASWYIKVQGGTWNTNLDLSGLRITGIEIDSGAVNVTITLPSPLGVVPIKVNSGIVNVTLHRPRSAAVHAVVSAGSVKVRFDRQSLRVGGSDVTWDSHGALNAADRYDLRVWSGCVKVMMDDSAPEKAVPSMASGGDGVEDEASDGDSGVVLILDGIERRLGRP